MVAENAPPPLQRLLKRRDFLRLSTGGRRVSTAHFVLLAQETPPGEAAGPRVGFTATKKLGNAPQRNRIRRRLKEAVRLSADAAKPGFDYVLIARNSALLCDFAALLRDVRYALAKGPSAPMQAPRPPKKK